MSAQTNTQHTPGPWSVIETVDGIDVVAQSETGSLVCEFPYGTDDSENGANARLIAAAPDGDALIEKILAADASQFGSAKQFQAWCALIAKPYFAKATGAA